MFVRRYRATDNTIGTVNRKTSIFILLLVTVSLTTLGVKMSGLSGISSGSGKPKPRPRAVIQNQIKTCKQVVKTLADTVACGLPHNGVVVASQPLAQPLHPFPVSYGSAAFLLPSSSRAPPTELFSV